MPLLIGIVCLGTTLPGMVHICVPSLQMRDGCHTQKGNITDTVGAHRAIEQGRTNVENQNGADN